MFSKKNKYIVTFLFLLLPSLSFGAVFHVILVGDTLDEATIDLNKRIGESVKRDLIRLEEEMKNITEKAGFERINLKIIKGKYLTQKKIKETIENLEVGSNDAVFFSWNGHGANLDREQWPSMSIPFNGQMELVDVKARLQRKRPRLLIVMADTCNKLLDNWSWEKPRSRTARMKVVPLNNQEHNYRKLFMLSSGTILSVGSIKGEYSFGLYTEPFLNALEDEIKSTKNAEWDNILKKAAEITSKIGTKDITQPKQQPIFKIEHPLSTTVKLEVWIDSPGKKDFLTGELSKLYFKLNELETSDLPNVSNINRSTQPPSEMNISNKSFLSSTNYPSLFYVTILNITPSGTQNILVKNKKIITNKKYRFPESKDEAIKMEYGIENLKAILTTKPIRASISGGIILKKSNILLDVTEFWYNVQ